MSSNEQDPLLPKPAAPDYDAPPRYDPGDERNTGPAMVEATPGPQTPLEYEQQRAYAGAGVQAPYTRDTQPYYHPSTQTPIIYRYGDPEHARPAVAPASAPSHPAVLPNTYFAISIFITVVCFCMNPSSIVFGLAAVVFAMQGENKVNARDYSGAQTSGNIALALILFTILYTVLADLLVVSLIVGLTVGFVDENDYYYYYR